MTRSLTKGLQRFSLGCVLMLSVGANLVFALLTAASPPGDHKDRPYRRLIQLKAARSRWS